MSRPTSRLLSVSLRSDPAELAPLRKRLEAFAVEQGMEEARAGELGLCVNEALANVIRHAYAGRVDGPIEVQVEANGPSLLLRIRDWGSGVNPLERPPQRRSPDTPGGVGMICLRELMDQLRFEPQPDGMLLVMEKHLKPAAQSSPQTDKTT